MPVIRACEISQRALAPWEGPTDEAGGVCIILPGSGHLRLEVVSCVVLLEQRDSAQKGGTHAALRALSPRGPELREHPIGPC
jgi:hypothetical protein